MHPLLVAQLEEARSSDGTVDLTRLTQLVSATYHAADESGQGKSLPARRPPGAEAAAVIGLEELRAINARLHLALDNMSQGLCLYDEQDRVLFVSRRMTSGRRSRRCCRRSGRSRRVAARACPTVLR